VGRLSGFGVSVELPSGWDARLYGRDLGGPARAALHAGTFPLPNERGDFGSGAVELMGDDDVFVVLLEYDPASVDQALFSAAGQPRALASEAFSASVLQRALPGQAGAQTFFAASGRAFCLYVVLGQLANRYRLVERANDVIGAIRIDG
jgi:hypothetical protein